MSQDRRSVKTYVPAEQKSTWQRHADELGMSQSEFVRTMVQAGRRGFSLSTESNREQPDPEGSNPGGNDLERRIESAIADGHRSWDDLVEAVFDGFEESLEEALDSLQERDRVRYSGREGGYTLVDE
ncbi:hypothetical protein DQW50_05300 [Halorubrum sp. 48-1-W]|uniref:DUF5805 domain-containing protein n=1 Tax=Halorubrum sp. 48-1-W TaxID=2249761 RepID=UPI000DCF533E|nr:DUF5805 domain-containing protein [Halorubrum sp. 48-1-W]RAW46192.1 hypothetical protein DQW50_05300 [Halorubrum sp. 48-1-W]